MEVPVNNYKLRNTSDLSKANVGYGGRLNSYRSSDTSDVGSPVHNYRLSDTSDLSKANVGHRGTS